MDESNYSRRQFLRFGGASALAVLTGGIVHADYPEIRELNHDWGTDVWTANDHGRERWRPVEKTLSDTRILYVTQRYNHYPTCAGHHGGLFGLPLPGDEEIDISNGHGVANQRYELHGIHSHEVEHIGHSAHDHEVHTFGCGEYRDRSFHSQRHAPLHDYHHFHSTRSGKTHRHVYRHEHASLDWRNPHDLAIINDNRQHLIYQTHIQPSDRKPVLELFFVNDNYGVPRGKDVSKHMASILARILNRTDVAAVGYRIGEKNLSYSEGQMICDQYHLSSPFAVVAYVPNNHQVLERVHEFHAPDNLEDMDGFYRSTMAVLKAKKVTKPRRA